MRRFPILRREGGLARSPLSRPPAPGWRRGGMALGALALLPSLLGGQSLLGIQGLGYPLEPLDARARALGSVGVGLRGTSLLPADPAAAAALAFPALELSLQPQWGSGSRPGEELTIRSHRFPLIALGYPVRRLGGVATLSIGTFMDQRWELTRAWSVDLEGTPTPVTDNFRSEGGVSAVRLTWAQRLGEKLALAAGLGRHTGAVSRVFTRTFDSLKAGTETPTYREGGRWGYGGLTAHLGLSWDPAEFLRLSGALDWSADLQADPDQDTQGGTVVFDLPTELRLGATGVLTPELDLTVGVAYADWQPSQGGLDTETVTGGIWSLGGGLEWRGITRGVRSLPLRVGARRSRLPFRFGETAPTETLLAAGMGFDLLRVQDAVLGGLDLAVERGAREAGDLSERFWRGTLTIRVAGF